MPMSHIVTAHDIIIMQIDSHAAFKHACKMYFMVSRGGDRKSYRNGNLYRELLRLIYHRQLTVAAQATVI